MTIPRYPPSFRQDEISLICRSALTGESLCFVGLAGSGKSNIINFLSVDPYGYKPQYLDPTTEPVIFAKINAETWDGSAQNLWEQLWVELANLTADLVDAEAVPKIIALSEDVRAFNKLQQQVDLVCGHYQRPVMFILDDFDDALRAGPLSMLEQFNRLRSNHRGRLSYLIFTKKLPHVLGRAHNLETHSKFYDLFKNHVYALKLYNAEEARQMLLHLNALNDNALDRGALLTIETLCGGHARLLRLLYDAWLRGELPLPDARDGDYARHPDMHKECARILHGLHRHEQQVAIALAQGQQSQADSGVIAQLALRGLLTNTSPPQWFSPLMAAFLKDSASGDTTE
ncbi:MAG: hypothetical protein KDE47_14235 [Caldilineaceae bacterium]|nr:hypothetical protein [Caldilineaceae bacterium]